MSKDRVSELMKQFSEVQPATTDYKPDSPKPFLQYDPSNRDFQVKASDVKKALVLKRNLLPSSIIISGHNTSLYEQIENLGEFLDNPPYKIVGRDNSVTLKNSSANTKVVYTYEYARGKGELLDFNIQTEYAQASTEIAKSSDISPDDKSIIVDTTQVMPKTDINYKDGKMQYPTPFEQRDNTIVEGNNPWPALRKSQETYKFPSLSPTPITPEDVYNSESDAIKDIQDNYEISQSDYNEYWEALKKTFDELKNPTSKDATDILVKTVHELQPYIIKKRVYIKDSVDPVKTWDDNVGKYLHPDVYNTEIPNLNLGEARSLYPSESQRRIKGVEYLKTRPDIVVMEEPGQDTGNVNILRSTVVEIPITGARILASGNYQTSNQVLGNDLLKRVSNQVTAKGRIVGNPGLEEGMNIELKNISERYSGVWHIEKITHVGTNSGYYCDIEFTKKTLDLSVNTVRATVNTQEIFGNLNEIAKESLKTKAYKYPSEIVNKFNKWREDNGKPDQNYYLVQDKDDASKATIYSAESDFLVSTIDLSERDLTEETSN